jgi:hypothetical protein
MRQGGTHAAAAARPSGARATAPTPRESCGWQRRGRGASASPPRVRRRAGAEEGPAALRRTGPTQPRDVRRQRRVQPWSLIPDCYELRCEGKVIGGLGLICGGIRAESYSTRGYCSRLGLWRWLGLEGRRERRPRGFAHGQQERRVFLLISCLIKLIHLLSLNREDYLTPKRGLDLIPKPNPNGPLGPLNP